MKLGTHVLPEALNQIISSLLAQPTKKASYRDSSKNYGREDEINVKRTVIYYTNTNKGNGTVQKDDMDKACLSLHPK